MTKLPKDFLPSYLLNIIIVFPNQRSSLTTQNNTIFMDNREFVGSQCHSNMFHYSLPAEYNIMYKKRSQDLRSDDSTKKC
mmetsp:Transcript_29848/g.44396  ORF Transcript_29848/g.44396 Transcript_29848/m.44396 type:complete len:80 (+) Transcript_29848:37-276(+)